mmetsp:Transcript_42521/g.99130  ORF Transcript_42521/g.99130 Transcript_42521/m.99130 type:complete len:86 (+) Transcript_42521:730-987(+)
MEPEAIGGSGVWRICGPPGEFSGGGGALSSSSGRPRGGADGGSNGGALFRDMHLPGMAAPLGVEGKLMAMREGNMGPACGVGGWL